MSVSYALTLIAKGDDEIVVTRTFNAPRQMVFDAHTKPELLRRWFGVRNGWTFVVCDVDLRVGGSYCYRWRHEGKGMDLQFRGVYREITAPDGFVCTEIFEEPFHAGEAVNTYSFVEENGETTLTISTRYPSRQVRDMAAKSGMETGLNESYLLLDGLLV
jgi:uncharacterized protein YndB with AHSA1/START domain